MPYWLVLFVFLVSMPTAASLPWPVGDDSVPEWSRAPYPFPRSQRVRLDGDRLGDCLAQATLDYTSTPRLSRARMSRSYSSDTFLAYLAADPQLRFRPYASGREEALRAWVMDQPDQSISPVSLYRSALELCEGNVWNAILTIHQLLRSEARWWDTRWYAYRSTYERQTEFFRRFIDIRGDLRERDRRRFTGDHGGTWYRIWGMMLGFLMEIDEREWNSHFTRHGREFVQCRGVAPGMELLVEWQGIQSQVTATLAEWLKPLIWESEDDWRKAEYNRAAARTATRMTRRIYAQRRSASELARCQDPDYYIRPDSD